MKYIEVCGFNATNSAEVQGVRMQGPVRRPDCKDY